MIYKSGSITHFWPYPCYLDKIWNEGGPLDLLYEQILWLILGLNLKRCKRLCNIKLPEDNKIQNLARFSILYMPPVHPTQ